jgi:hypothetical protein
MSYAEEIAASRRLATLLALYFAPGYTLNRAALRDQVERTGYVVGMDEMISELEWLVSVGLIELVELDVVRLTYRGEDVSIGRIQIAGVRRPLPDQPKASPKVELSLMPIGGK